MRKNYNVMSKDYLQRARSLLDQSDIGALFYAAFELRCGIEARLQEYLEAQQHISQKKKEGWRIARLGKNIEHAFRLGDKVVEIAVVNEKTSDTILVLYYTPVTKKLRKMGGKLGDYLHAQKKYFAPEDDYWKQMRIFLESAYIELEKANKGNLLGPPILHKKTGKVDMTLEADTEEEGAMLLKFLPSIGERSIIRVKYLEDIPLTLH
jgi:hypothetical protein